MKSVVEVLKEHGTKVLRETNTEVWVRNEFTYRDEKGRVFGGSEVARLPKLRKAILQWLGYD